MSLRLSAQTCHDVASECMFGGKCFCSTERKEIYTAAITQSAYNLRVGPFKMISNLSHWVYKYNGPCYLDLNCINIKK